MTATATTTTTTATTTTKKKTLSSRLTTWLFAPTRPVLAPVLRVVLLAWVFFERFDNPGGQVAAHLASRPLPLLHAPHVQSLVGAFDAWPMTPATTDALGLALRIACVAAVLGVLTRVSLAVVAVGFVVTYGVMSGWGFFNHTPAIGGQLVIALVVVPGSTAWSVDRLLLTWWRRRRGAVLSWRDGLAPLVPRFGELLLLLVVGSLYFASGFAKVRYDVGDWLDGSTLQFYLTGGASRGNMWIGPADTDFISAYVYGAQPPGWLRRLATSTLLCAVLSWVTLVVELGAPFFLLAGGRWRVMWCLGAIAFHTGIVLMMGISFWMWVVVDAVVALVVIVPALAARFSSSTR